MDKRFEQMDKRFEQMDKRFEAMQQQMDKRFDEINRRMDRFMTWSFGITLTTGGLVVALLKLWN
jgi:predicted transcriptional regulator